MNIRDISNDTKETYRLAENERAVFLARNRNDRIVFELEGPGAEARIFALYSGSGTDSFSPEIVVRHLASDTVSRTTVRGDLSDTASLRFRGLIEVVRNAVRSDAGQDVRIFLRSEDARASSAPELEIDTDDVSCSHAATIAPPDPEQLFFLATRGLPKERAIALLADGFFRDAKDAMSALSTDTIRPI
jgi:Fe-S cluster assembly protein SufD